MPRPIHLAFVAVLVVSAGARGQTSAWERALALHKAGDLAGAAEAYKTVLAADRDRFDARSNLGAVLVALGRYPEAIEQYQLALASAPAQFQAPLRQNLALAFYKSGQYSAAITSLLELKTGSAQNKQIDLLLADCYLQNGDATKAAQTLATYEADAATDKGIAYLLGTALIRSGDAVRGQKVVDTILRDGKSAESHFLVGVSMFTAHDYPSAIREFAAALQLNPDLPLLHSYYGQALLFTGDPDGAAAAFREELARNANDFDSNLRLGEILQQRRSLNQALRLFEKAGQLRPDSFEAQSDLAGLRIARKESQQAIELLASITKRWPSAREPHVQLAALYDETGHLTEAATERAIASRFTPSSQESASSGPKPGEPAPPFTLPKLGTTERVSLDQLRAGKPIVLLFGSYTCPNFRGQAEVINKLAAQYQRTVPFLLVYIREAHTGDTWQSTINQRDSIDWQPARTQSEMHDHASLCVRKLKMNFPAVVDELDGQVEAKYAAWPSRLYLIGGNGKILYRTGLSELDFRPAEFEQALRSAL